MLKKLLVPVGALSLVLTSVAAPVQAVAQTVEEQDSSNPFASSGAAIGVPLFLGVIIFIILLGTGTIFDDDDNENGNPLTP